MKRKLLGILLALVLVMIPATPVLAATTADVTLTATPKFIAIADNVTSYDFGNVAESATPAMPTAYVGITNTSSIQTDQTISVTTTTWAGGVTWAHSETATPGVDTAGLKASDGDGLFDIIVKNGTPNDIKTNLAATTDYSYEVKLFAPTAFGDGIQKSITLRITAAEG